MSAQKVWSFKFKLGRKKSGFTLVELLVVISIIAILSVIGMTVFTSVQKSARDAKRRVDIHAIAKALEIYKLANGSYPTAGAVSCETNWDTLKITLAPYIQDLPKDPQNICDWDVGKFYKYHPRDNGAGFEVAASLENVSQSTGDFTYNCAVAVDICIFRKAEGGFGFENQQ